MTISYTISKITGCEGKRNETKSNTQVVEMQMVVKIEYSNGNPF